jgi:hypothetical protein
MTVAAGPGADHSWVVALPPELARAGPRTFPAPRRPSTAQPVCTPCGGNERGTHRSARGRAPRGDPTGLIGHDSQTGNTPRANLSGVVWHLVGRLAVATPRCLRSPSTASATSAAASVGPSHARCAGVHAHGGVGILIIATAPPPPPPPPSKLHEARNSRQHSDTPPTPVATHSAQPRRTLEYRWLATIKGPIPQPPACRAHLASLASAA